MLGAKAIEADDYWGTTKPKPRRRGGKNRKGRKGSDDANDGEVKDGPDTAPHIPAAAPAPTAPLSVGANVPVKPPLKELKAAAVNAAAAPPKTLSVIERGHIAIQTLAPNPAFAEKRDHIQWLVKLLEDPKIPEAEREPNAQRLMCVLVNTPGTHEYEQFDKDSERLKRLQLAISQAARDLVFAQRDLRKKRKALATADQLLLFEASDEKGRVEMLRTQYESHYGECTALAIQYEHCRRKVVRATRFIICDYSNIMVGACNRFGKPDFRRLRDREKPGRGWQDPRVRINANAFRTVVGGDQEIGGAFLFGSIPPEPDVWNEIENQNWIVTVFRRNQDGLEYRNDGAVQAMLTGIEYSTLYDVDDPLVTIVLTAGDGGYESAVRDALTLKYRKAKFELVAWEGTESTDFNSLIDKEPQRLSRRTFRLLPPPFADRSRRIQFVNPVISFDGKEFDRHDKRLAFTRFRGYVTSDLKDVTVTIPLERQPNGKGHHWEFVYTALTMADLYVPFQVRDAFASKARSEDTTTDIILTFPGLVLVKSKHRKDYLSEVLDFYGAPATDDPTIDQCMSAIVSYLKQSRVGFSKPGAPVEKLSLDISGAYRGVPPRFEFDDEEEFDVDDMLPIPPPDVTNVAAFPPITSVLASGAKPIATAYSNSAAAAAAAVAPTPGAASTGADEKKAPKAGSGSGSSRNKPSIQPGAPSAAPGHASSGVPAKPKAPIGLPAGLRPKER